MCVRAYGVCVAHLQKQQPHQVIAKRRKRKKSQPPIVHSHLQKPLDDIRFRLNMERVAATKIANNKNASEKKVRKVFQRQLKRPT